MQRVVPFSSKSFSFTIIIWKPLHHPVIVKEDIKQSFFSILVPRSPKGRSNDDWIWEPSLLAVSSCWNNTCVPPALRINSLCRIFWNPSFTPRRVRVIFGTPEKDDAMSPGHQSRKTGQPHEGLRLPCQQDLRTWSWECFRCSHFNHERSGMS